MIVVGLIQADPCTVCELWDAEQCDKFNQVLEYSAKKREKHLARKPTS